MKKAFFMICLAVETAAFAFFALTALSGVVGKEDALIAVACLLTPLLLGAISISCLIKCRRNKEKLVSHSLLMKLSVFLVCMSVSFLAFEDGWIATLVFLIPGLILTGVTVLLIRKPWVVRKPGIPGRPAEYAFKYKGKWEWEAASAEYRRLKGIMDGGALTDEENELIYAYTAVPFSYMFYWLAVSGFLNRSFDEEYADADIVGAMKRREITPVEALGQLDYYFGSEYLLPGIIRFFRSYYYRQGAFTDSATYLYDYYEMNGEPEDRYYCMDFSWDVCERLTARIEERYTSWNKRFSSNDDKDYHEDERFDRKVHSALFGTDLNVCASGVKYHGFPGGTDVYVDRCAAALDALSDRQIRMLERIFDDDYGVEETPEATSIDAFRPETLHILEPRDENDLVFAVSGEADFEPEHGISFTVRNGLIIDTGFSYDFDDPYSEENLRRYENMPALDFARIRTEADAAPCLQTGELVRVKLLPEPDACKTDSSEEYVYLPPHALAAKERNEQYIRNLRAFSGLPDLEVLYSPHYLTDRDGIRQSIVPRRLYIRTKDKKIWVQFFFIVDVWD